jgi:hypothetical protein
MKSTFGSLAVSVRRSYSGHSLRGGLASEFRSGPLMAILGGKLHYKPRCLIGAPTSSALIVDIANGVIIGIRIYGSFWPHMRAAMLCSWA